MDAQKRSSVVVQPTPEVPAVPANAMRCFHAVHGSGSCVQSDQAASGRVRWLVVWDEQSKGTHGWVPSTDLTWSNLEQAGG